MSPLIFIDGGAGGPVPTIEYLGTDTSSSDLTAYTFTGKALGTAAADRKIIIGIVARRTFTPTLTVPSVTVGGVSAAVVPGTTNPGPTGDITTLTTIWIASVPTGTTGDVVVTFNNAATRCAISLWKATGITGTPSAVATYFESASNTTPVSLNANVTAGSVVVAIAIMAGGTAGVWTGATEDNDGAVDTSRYTSAHHTASSSESPRTISVAHTGSASDRAGSLAVFN